MHEGTPSLLVGPNGGTRHGQSVEARFWAKVDVRGPDECWEWQASTTSSGYGQIMVNARPRRITRAHRLSWTIANGPIPSGMVVCHRCDNPPCVNPAHLFVATQQDNIADMVRKGRGFVPPPEARWGQRPEAVA